MSSVMIALTARYAVGQVVHHTLFDYRGVVVDVDAEFSLSNEWYETMALSRPPRDRPWYHVLRHGTAVRTYVAERNLNAETSGDPIQHPDLDAFFVSFEGGRYVARDRGN
jgi:heat shock protein HspQ